MPIKKSAAKADRRSKKLRAVNLQHKTAMKGAIKTLKKAAIKGEGDTTAMLSSAYKLIDKAAKENIIHKNNAARKKSRLTKMINKTAAGK